MKNKINVNISPNPLDLQTLHCSQNDTGERKFYFTLHNNGEVIDTSDISDPIFEPFDVYKGGTEQLEPINTDVPTTSPIIADIQYPDEEKTEQEFTYRESPTTLDGNAIIEKLYGNTLVWNQLMEHGNFDATTGFGMSNLTSVSVSGGVFNGVCNNTGEFNVYISRAIPTNTAHKILVAIDVKCSEANAIRLRWPYISSASSLSANTWHRFAVIVTPNSSYNTTVGVQMNGILDATYQFRNYMCIDLTTMFGSGNEPSTVEEFTSLFPLPYYQFEQGKLLSFNGSGIKTVGKNLYQDGDVDVNNILFKSVTLTEPIEAGTYDISAIISHPEGTTGNRISFRNRNGSGIGVAELRGDSGARTSKTFTVTEDVYTLYFYYALSTSGSGIGSFKDIQIEKGTEASPYTPYIESTTSIPTSTYFPNGMRSVPTAYDEQTNKKAYTRIAEMDLGGASWSYDSTNTRFYFTLNDLKTGYHNSSNYLPFKCVKYENAPHPGSASITDKHIGTGTSGGASSRTVIIMDTNYTDVDTFKASLNGVMLQYELKDEETTQFTHASLICEDGESTLYQDVDSLVCDCTEDFSKDSGFKDCKIKFTNDGGVVYSNKIQLHIERKP